MNIKYEQMTYESAFSGKYPVCNLGGYCLRIFGTDEKWSKPQEMQKSSANP
jgi:hypothetical protein